jgi:hypothetical protein
MRTRPVSGAQVRAYAGKAEEYADAAASEIEAGRSIAATSLAIHAGINAADAVCGARRRDVVCLPPAVARRWDP